MSVYHLLRVSQLWRRESRAKPDFLEELYGLQRASQNVWQTSPLGQLRIASRSTFIKMNCSSSRGKTSLAWTCQSLSRTSQCRLHQLWGSSTTDYSAAPTSLLCPDPADLPSTTSTGSSLSSQRTQRDSWFQSWSSPTWITAIHSWLDSKLLWLNHCSVSRTLQHASFSTYPNSPTWPPSSVTSAGFLL